MSKVSVFMANGLEEVECLAVVDMLRRGGIEVEMISVNGEKTVTGSHNISIIADTVFEKADISQSDLLFLPGGMPGVTNLGNHQGLCQCLKTWAKENKPIAAICAAPSLLGQLGLFKGKQFTCYPGFEKYLSDGKHMEENIVADGTLITAKSVAYAIDLGIKLVEILEGENKAIKLKEDICKS